ncbi:MAG: Gfo/Idh/MocA family oxidoreductase [Candidatus Hydrogenedentes bacterium]|nr:Gfo/Idh/MocA family oxidoreductase [Candidatus Hydrogenedentota bacterium]
MSHATRRSFLKGSLGAAAALAALPAGAGTGAAASDKIVVGIMGVGGRGCALLTSLVKRSDVVIKYICDADTRCSGAATEIVMEGHEYRPAFVQDFRAILADPEVDALICSTSDRWHALATIMACQAGKDVYVEKPHSMSVWDGQQMIAAARKYERIVQVGMQTRSAPYVKSAMEYIQSGKLGDVKLARVYLMQDGGPYNVSPEEAVPEGLDYDLWCGPSPMLPYRPGRWFEMYWDFYNGALTGDLIHQVDLARLLIGKKSPDSVCSAGGVYRFDDGRETPDTQFTTFEFGDVTYMMEGAFWCPYNHRIVHLPDKSKFPDWQFSATKIEILGTQGIMYFGRHGGGWEVYEGDAQTRSSHPVASEISEYKWGSIIDLHFEDFFQCIRDRKTPKTEVGDSHYSMNLCHLANISNRVGNQKLKWDGEKEVFIDNDEANRLLKANYREPWVVPETV